jgi:AcrR family transcriptional regulator
VIEAAMREFQVHGYAATCMGAVAQRAGVSTKTLYRLIPTKTELFSMVVIERIGRFMLEVDDDTLDALDLSEALRHMLVAYGKLALSPETLAFIRLVIGECDRFPEIAATFYEHAVVRISRRIEGWLARQAELGRLRITDAKAAAGMLRGMMVLDPQHAVMLGRCSAPGPDEIDARANACADLFLDGYATKSAS